MEAKSLVCLLERGSGWLSCSDSTFVRSVASFRFFLVPFSSEAFYQPKISQHRVYDMGRRSDAVACKVGELCIYRYQ
jgi:hypothetical protein